MTFLKRDSAVDVFACVSVEALVPRLVIFHWI